jgi:hypothetical protein
MAPLTPDSITTIRREFTQALRMNTQFIIYIVQTMKLYIGGSYLDLFFDIPSIWILWNSILMRICEEIYEALHLEQPLYTYLILLLPSIHYWTTAIGKDALFFSR